MTPPFVSKTPRTFEKLPDFTKKAHLASLPPLGDHDLEHLPWLNAIMAMMKEAVITVNCEGEITYLNPAAEALTLCKKEDALCKNSAEVFTLLDAETNILIRSPAIKSILKKTLIKLETPMILVRGNDARIFVDGSAYPIRNCDGEAIGATLMLRNITELKNARTMSQQLLAVLFQRSQIYLNLIKQIIERD